MPRTSVESSEREALGSATQVGLFAAYLSTSVRARYALLNSNAMRSEPKVSGEKIDFVALTNAKRFSYPTPAFSPFLLQTPN